LVKRVSDDLYLAANKEDLEKAAEKVMAEAQESNHGSDTILSDVERLPEERRSKLPRISLQEDSVLRAQMKEISSKPMLRGRIINILLIGIDSRLNVRDARADAIHLVSINPDSAVVEIMSVPRDTYCDLGYPDTTTFNIVANARATGYDGFMRRIAELTKRGPVRYYAEVGFSQVMGILEILGYKDPVNTLKFLRTRKTLPGGDVQRSHNQAIFIRKNLMDKFSLVTGATGDLILYAGLHFLSTNMTKDFCKGLIYALEKKGFPHHRSDAIRLRMLPMYKLRLKEMSDDSATVASTLRHAQRVLGDDASYFVDVASYLRKHNRLAMQDSLRPGRVITRLKRLNEQHAWIQIRDMKTRIGVRDTLVALLEHAYRMTGKFDEAEKVSAARKAEDLLMQQERNR